MARAIDQPRCPVSLATVSPLAPPQKYTAPGRKPLRWATCRYQSIIVSPWSSPENRTAHPHGGGPDQRKQKRKKRPMAREHWERISPCLLSNAFASSPATPMVEMCDGWAPDRTAQCSFHTCFSLFTLHFLSTVSRNLIVSHPPVVTPRIESPHPTSTTTRALHTSQAPTLAAAQWTILLPDVS